MSGGVGLVSLGFISWSLSWVTGIIPVYKSLSFDFGK